MLELRPLDALVPICQQLHVDVAPVVLINIFQVAEPDIPALLQAWENDANWMKQQAGYISTQLHRGIGGSGFLLSKTRRGRLVEAKQKRMPVIAANGLLVLIPCAVVLNRWAEAGSFDQTFYAVQALELLAGAVNLALMGLNMRDGLKLSRRAGAGRGKVS